MNNKVLIQNAVSASNADGNGVTDGETSPTKENT